MFNSTRAAISLIVSENFTHNVEATKRISKEEKLLFLSFRKPHGPVSSQSLSKWIKVVLSECDIDVSFTAQHEACVETPKTSEKGISIDLIKKTAGFKRYDESSRWRAPGPGGPGAQIFRFKTLKP